jgi:hypothetical protein
MRFLIIPAIDRIGIYPFPIDARIDRAFIEKAGWSR